MIRVKWMVGLALVSVIGAALLVPLVGAKTMKVDLQSGPFAPNAQGEIKFNVADGTLAGDINAKNLPAQGAHAFYVLWFVRTDTGDKAFLGPLIGQDSILFLVPGDGSMRFRAAAFTDGPNAGSGISLGANGVNLFVVLAEDHINTFMPSPVSPPPASVALQATF